MLLIQLLLAGGLLFVSLLLFVMIRQIGVVTQRIPKKTDSGVTNPLPVGTTIPLREVVTFDGGTTLTFAPGRAGGSLLLFVSFSCPVCNQLLRQLGAAPAHLRDRLALFLLDTDVGKRYARKIDRLGLTPYPIVEAYELAAAFRIWRAPFVYVVDGEGTVLDAFAVASATELVALVRQHFGVPAEREERVHV